MQIKKNAVKTEEINKYPKGTKTDRPSGQHCKPLQCYTEHSLLWQH